MIVKEWKQECKSCKGTGLYVGMAEGTRGGAVVCYTCKGTGEQLCHFEFEPFIGRNPSPQVTHVYHVNPGIGVDNGIIVPGGVSKEEWERNPNSVKEPGREMRLHTCPAWWYQAADSEKKPDWDECPGCGTFASCEFFNLKEQCWARWDMENNELV